MNQAPAKLQFVSNLLTSKIFLTQLATLIASIVSAAGVHVLDDQGTQQQLIVLLDLIATTLLHWLSTNGPVSLTAPISVPPPRDVPSGVSVVTVASKKEQDVTAAAAVQPIAVGSHTVDVVPPVTVGVAVPAAVIVTPCN